MEAAEQIRKGPGRPPKAVVPEVVGRKASVVVFGDGVEIKGKSSLSAVVDKADMTMTAAGLHIVFLGREYLVHNFKKVEFAPE